MRLLKASHEFFVLNDCTELISLYYSKETRGRLYMLLVIHFILTNYYPEEIP